MDSVFLVQYVNILPSGEESIKVIGVYRTLRNATEAVARSSKLPGFCEHPATINADATDEIAGFHVDEYKLDQDHWREGFVTMVGTEEYRE